MAKATVQQKITAFGEWLYEHRKAAIALLVLSVLLFIVAKYFIFNKKGGSNAPDVSNPNADKPTVDRMTTIYLAYKSALTHDDLFYKGMADSIQSYLQSTTFFFSSDLYGRYFKDLTPADFVAVWYFWGPKREYSGSFLSNPFQGIDDKYGDLVQALKARCYPSDFNQIQERFKTTGLI